MGLNKLFLGIVIIVLGIVIWFSMFSSALNVFIESPQQRYEFRNSLEHFQTIYFLILIMIGISFVLWGAQT